MPQVASHFLICLLAFVAGLGLTLVALIGIVDMSALSIDGGVPSEAMMTPMIAVVVFWTVTRLAGVGLKAGQALLGGGIAIYGLLYLCGRMVATGSVSAQNATIIGALALFALGFVSIRWAARQNLQ